MKGPQTNNLPPLAATGVAGLDLILGGGLPRSRLYLVQGDPGVGKTTLALQFLLAGRDVGERSLYVTLGETRQELDDVARSHGWNLDGIEVFQVSTGDPDDELHEDESYDVFHPSEVELGAVMQTLVKEAERVRPVRCVIDSLSELRLLARDPLRYRRQLLALKRHFVGQGCTVLMLEAGSSEKVADLQSNTLVHGVIMMDQQLPPFGLKRRRMSIVKLRGVRFDDGYHDFKVLTGGVQVFPRLVAAEHDAAGAEAAISSGVREVDALLGGGLARGSSTVFLGAAGVGKSTLCSQYVTAAAARGEPSVIFTFDESVRTVLGRAESLGMPMRGHVEAGLVRVVQVDPGELAPGEFAQMVRDAVERGGARVVVIDSLTGYLNATPNERFLVVQLHELLTYLGNRGVCTLLVVAQHGMIGDTVQSSMDVSYLADAVVVLRYFEHDGHVRKAISVVKNRGGPHEQTIRELEIAPHTGVRVGAPLHGFHGVLSGTPVYTGGARELFGGARDGAAAPAE